jgi:hypothetical protein
MKIIYILLLAIALVALLRATQYFLNLTIRNKPWYLNVMKVLPWFEVLVWLGFAFWTLEYFLRGNPILNIAIASLIIAIVIVFSWFVLKDFIAGAVFRSEHALIPGTKIKTDNLSGTITHIGYVSMDVTDDDGETIKVHYSNISTKNLTRVADKGRGKSQTCKILIPQHFGAHNIEQILSRKLLEIPWIIAAGDIRINMHIQGDNYETEMTFYSINEEMFIKTEEHIRAFVKETFG